MAENKRKPKAGMSLHKFISTGGKPKDYKALNKTEAKRASSKQKGK